MLGLNSGTISLDVIRFVLSRFCRSHLSCLIICGCYFFQNIRLQPFLRPSSVHSHQELIRPPWSTKGRDELTRDGLIHTNPYPILKWQFHEVLCQEWFLQPCLSRML